MGGLLPTGPAPLACALPCTPGVVSGDVTVGLVEVALLSAGVDVGSVDKATKLSVVDVAAGGVVEMGVDEATELVDVAATCARTGLTIAKPITSAMTSAMAPANVVMVGFIRVVVS